VDGNLCFSGSESMPVHIEGVLSIETNDHLASWIYQKDGKLQREPDNFDMHLHYCTHVTITYSPPIELTKMFLTSVSASTKCTDIPAFQGKHTVVPKESTQKMVFEDKQPVEDEQNQSDFLVPDYRRTIFCSPS
jgi:hypothetical protein